MNIHGSNPAMPPVVAPPSVAEAEGTTSPLHAPDNHAADTRIPESETIFKKASFLRSLVIAASLVFTAFLIFFTIPHQLHKKIPTPDSGVSQHLALLSPAEKLPPNNNSTTQESGPPVLESKITQSAVIQPKRQSTALPKQSFHQQVHVDLKTPNAATEPSLTVSGAPEPQDQTTMLALAHFNPPTLHATEVSVGHGSVEMDQATADGSQQSSALQGTENPPNSNTPVPNIANSDKVLISTVPDANFFQTWRPLDWAAPVTEISPERATENAPEQKFSQPDALTVHATPIVRANEQCSSSLANYETRIKWFDQPVDAFQLAKNEDKLVFMIHISGNFKIPGFT